MESVFDGDSGIIAAVEVRPALILLHVDMTLPIFGKRAIDRPATSAPVMVRRGEKIQPPVTVDRFSKVGVVMTTPKLDCIKERKEGRRAIRASLLECVV